MPDISVVFVIKNGVKQGYCFWESLLSCLPFADHIFISDGFSDDGTYDYLIKFKNKYEDLVPITLTQDKWEDTSFHGEEIANVSNKIISGVTGDWIYYLQADEVIHEDSVEHIKHIATLDRFNSVSFPFYHFIRGWEPSEEGYTESIRMIRNGRNSYLMGDAWNFEGEINPICPAGHSPQPIFHFAWVFPKQNDVKQIEHGKLYKNHTEYQEKMQDALITIDQEKEPYPLTEFDDFPEITRRFIGKVKYELPEV